jgi:phosphoglycolate phosphatase
MLFPKNPINNVIFDFDGTIVDSAEDILSSLSAALSQFPEFAPVNFNKRVIGPQTADMIRNIVPRISDEQLILAVKEYRKSYDNGGFINTVPCEGVPELLSELSKRKISAFIVTNKPILPVNKILSKLSLDVFKDKAAPDSIPGRTLAKSEMISFLMNKWRIKKDDVMMVGDAVSDIQAGKNNGIMTVAVLNGYGDELSLRGSSPDHIYNDMAELASEMLKGRIK